MTAGTDPRLPRQVQYDPEAPVWADVNRYHPVADWDAYAKANVPGIVGIKISEGGLSSPKATEAVRSAEARGLIVVGYNFGTAGVTRFLSDFEPRPGRIPCLDYEGSSSTVRLAEVWIRAVAATWGRRPWFYGHEKWVEDGAPAGTEVERCPHWASQYGSHLDVPRGTGELVAWQFSDGRGGPIGSPRIHPGVIWTADRVGPVGCDMNSLLCSPARLLELAGLPPPGAPQPSAV